MGCFHVDVTLRSPVDRSRAVRVERLLVDTGSEATWVHAEHLREIGVAIEPEKTRTFETADGRRITRGIGYAIVEVTPECKTIDEVVFGEAGDMLLLGARTMEGLGCRVDPEGNHLVAAGPSVAAGNVAIDPVE